MKDQKCNKFEPFIPHNSKLYKNQPKNRRIIDKKRITNYCKLKKNISMRRDKEQV